MNNLWQRIKGLVKTPTMTVTIIWSFLGVFVPLAVAIGWYGVQTTSNSLQQTTEANLVTMSTQVSSEVERVLARSYQDIKTLADNPVIRSGEVSAEDKLAEMRKVQNFYRMFTDVTLINTEGDVITSTTYGYRGDWMGKDWFLKAASGDVAVSRPHIVLNPHQVVMAYAAPVEDDSQTATAVIVGQMNMKTIWGITDNTKLGGTGFARIIDDTGIHVAHPQEEKLFSRFAHTRNDIRITPDGIELFEYTDSSGDRIMGAQASLNVGPYTGGNSWHVIMCQSADEAFSLVWGTVRQVVIGVAGAIVLFIILSTMLIRRAVKPIGELSVGAGKIGGGDLTYRVPVSGTEETRRLAVAFNDMVRNLQTSEGMRVEHGLLRKLQAAGTALAGAITPDEVLQIMANGIRDILRADFIWILLTDQDRTHLESKVFVSPEKKAVSHASREKIDLVNEVGLLTKAFKDGKPLFLDDLAPFMDLTRGDRLLETMILQLGATSLNIVPLSLTDRNSGILAFGRTSGKALSDAEKRIVLVFAHQTTISLERARLQAIESESTNELTRLNNLKSRLLHILSHELKTPLTSLKSSSRLLLESDINVMDDKTQKRLIGNISRSTERLISVADDIYPLAEVLTGSMQAERKDVECRQIVEGAIKEVLALTEKKNQQVNVSIPPSSPLIWADDSLLQQALVSLLTNASNLSPNESRIDVVLHDKESEVIFEVTDQGIGISEDDRKSIFDGFYQADSEVVRRAGGKGLGLLYAKTVVGLHEGKIWVESTLGEGSTFHFSIPK